MYSRTVERVFPKYASGSRATVKKLADDLVSKGQALNNDRSSFVVRRSSFVVRRSSFVVRRSSFVVRRLKDCEHRYPD